MEIRYLGQSGFMVDTGARLLIFDYARHASEAGALEEGIVGPEAFAGRPALVFVSHRHADHYSPDIFRWRGAGRDIRYLLSDDIDPGEWAARDVALLGPGSACEAAGAQVRTLLSTDEGVAFLVKADGLTFYHAGDLHWWHWEGEPDAWNEQMGARFREQTDLLAGEKIDAAFLPVDPRLGDAYLYGLHYFMCRVGARAVIPMHFWERYEVFDRLLEDPQTAAYRERIVRFGRRGELLSLKE